MLSSYILTTKKALVISAGIIMISLIGFKREYEKEKPNPKLETIFIGLFMVNAAFVIGIIVGGAWTIIKDIIRTVM